MRSAAAGTVDTVEGAADAAAPPLLTRRLALPVGVSVASRVVTVAVAWVAHLVHHERVTILLVRWDGAQYLRIVTGGYPATPPRGSGATAQTVHAFFPVYPLVARALDRATAFEPITALVVANAVMATLATALVWLVARDLAGDAVADRTAVLFAFFPGAFVLGMAYSEGAFIALAAACLLALHRRRWVAAGLAAAVAGATRPTGPVLALCCAWAAAEAVRRRRDWRALTAPALAPLGFVAWSVFLDARTGRALAWKDAQEQGWGQGFDLGANTLRTIGRVAVHPFADLRAGVCALTVVLVGAGLVLLWRWRPPAAVGIYTAGILLPALASSVLTSTPRFALTAFPLIVALARVATGRAFAATAALSAAAMVALMLVAELSLAYTP